MSRTVPALVVAVALAACAPSLRIAAPTVRYPVSLTGVVLGPDYQPLDPAALEEVATITSRSNVCALADANPGDAIDLSATLNDAIERSDAEAVVDFRVRLLPPEGEQAYTTRNSRCVTLEATGRVVRRTVASLGIPELEAACDGRHPRPCAELTRRRAEVEACVGSYCPGSPLAPAVVP